MMVSSSVMSTTLTSLCAERDDLADRRLGERLEGARDGHFAIEHVGR